MSLAVSRRDDVKDADGSRGCSRLSSSRRSKQEDKKGAQFSMNGKDAERSDEKLTSHSRDSGRISQRVELCERQTGTAKRENPFPDDTFLMEAVLERDNMLVAYKRVVSNKGAPGIDGMTTGDLKSFLQTHWLQLKDELLAGEYKPNPVKQVEIPKPDGGVRKLGIPTVVDRLIQQALNQVLSPIFEKVFSESSYGFRPGRGTHQAVTKAREYIAEGRRWVVDMDLEKFFDRVNHDTLMSRIARKIKDKKILLLIRRYLQSGVMIGGLETVREEGTPQGGPLSPLLSNILLDDLDKELKRREHKFCRYADDCNIYVGSKEAGERVMASIKTFLEDQLKLKVNEEKSKVARPWKRKFLGYSFTQEWKTRIRIAEKSVTRMKDKLREKLRDGKGKNLKETIKGLKPLLNGWINYFKLTEVKNALQTLDAWIRRKLRRIIWKQMKSTWTRAKTLIKRGIEEQMAWNTALSRKGSWRMASVEAMHKAFPNSYLEELGLVSLCIKKGWSR